MGILILLGGFKNITFINCVVLMFTMFVLYFSNIENVRMTLINFSNAVFAISAISLFFFVFATCLGIIHHTAYYPRSVIEWGIFNYFDYYHLYCSAQVVTSFGYTGYRNMAFFLEGPMFSYVLSIALFCEFYLWKEKNRKIVVIIEIVAMITCFSTTGFLVLLFILAIKYFGDIKRNRVLKFMLIPLAVLVVAYFSYIVVLEKVTYASNSANLRFDDALSSIKCFVHHPIFGVGFENMRGIDPYRSILRRNASLSTGIGAVMATGGVILSCWYILPFLISLYSIIKKREMRSDYLFVLLLFFLMMNTIVQSKIIGTLFCSISWCITIKRNVLKGLDI